MECPVCRAWSWPTVTPAEQPTKGDTWVNFLQPRSLGPRGHRQRRHCRGGPGAVSAALTMEGPGVLCQRGPGRGEEQTLLLPWSLHEGYSLGVPKRAPPLAFLRHLPATLWHGGRTLGRLAGLARCEFWGGCFHGTPRLAGTPPGAGSGVWAHTHTRTSRVERAYSCNPGLLAGSEWRGGCCWEPGAGPTEIKGGSRLELEIAALGPGKQVGGNVLPIRASWP